MKTLSIRELHATTGKIVRQTNHDTFLITDNGKPIAVLKAASLADFGGNRFPIDHWKCRSQITSNGNSTSYVAEDRSLS
jgi:prevent-host-death family protein